MLLTPRNFLQLRRSWTAVQALRLSSKPSIPDSRHIQQVFGVGSILILSLSSNNRWLCPRELQGSQLHISLRVITYFCLFVNFNSKAFYPKFPEIGILLCQLFLVTQNRLYNSCKCLINTHWISLLSRVVPEEIKVGCVLSYFIHLIFPDLNNNPWRAGHCGSWL